MIRRVIEYLKEHRMLVIASLLFFIIRLFYLDHAYLLRGERDIVLTGYFLAENGKDLYGNFMPKEFYNIDMPTPFLSFYYSALWWILLPFKTTFFARLPYVIATTTYIFLVYEIVRQITKNKLLSVLTALVFSFSPGIYHLSRLALEVNIATPLLFAGILLYLKKQRWYAFLFFILSYFSYNGFKPLILPLILYLEFYFLLKGESTKQFIKNSVIGIIFFIGLIVLSFGFIDGGLTLSRKADLVFLSYDDIDPLVIYRRNSAIGPELFKQVFNNKITATVYYIIDVFIQGQDLRYLFFKGDPAAIYATTFTGLFFLWMLPMYYLGFFHLARNLKKEYLYILGFILVGLIPSLINIDYISFTIRSILSTLGYAYIIAAGMVFFWKLISGLKMYLKVGIIGVFVAIFAVEMAYFTYNYFYRRPVTMFEMFFESEKDVAQYLLDDQKDYYIYDDSPRNILATYYFLKPKLNVAEAQVQLKKGFPYKFDGNVMRGCPVTGEKIRVEKGVIVAESCLDKDVYETLARDEKIETIKYEDFSFKKAYFIFNSYIPKSQ